MANIKIELDYPLTDGMSLTFKAPCDNTAVTGLKVYYPEVGESGTTTTSKTFTFKDAHLNTISALGNLFSEGATVVVVVDTNNSYAFIQNADTNGYLENKATSVAKGGTGGTTASEALTNLGALPLSGGTMTGPLNAESVVICDGTLYPSVDYKADFDGTVKAQVLANMERNIVYFRNRCLDTEYYENYLLPDPDKGRTKNGNYTVWTNKNLTLSYSNGTLTITTK